MMPFRLVLPNDDNFRLNFHVERREMTNCNRSVAQRVLNVEVEADRHPGTEVLIYQSTHIIKPGHIRVDNCHKGSRSFAKNAPGVSLAFTSSGTRIHSPIYKDKARPRKEPRILKIEQELRHRGHRRRDRDLGADCLKRRSSNKRCGGERGDRKPRRAVAELKSLSMLSSDADVSRSLPAQRDLQNLCPTSSDV
eukprot:5931605-Pleurochrysis_carterae.AAC.1